MEIRVANERVFIIKSKLSFDEAKERAHAKKVDAFGTINKFASFLQKPKTDDFELLYQEFRYQPFWYIACRGLYVFDRKTTYRVPTRGSHVQSLSIDAKQYTAKDGAIELPAIEHCRQEEKEEVFVDGITSTQEPKLKVYIDFPATECPNDVVTGRVPKEAIVVPPAARSSAIVRDTVGKMMHGIQADTISEEHLEVENVDLYYHPIYAFRFRWKSKNKEAILEFDGVTEEMRTGNRTFQEYMGKILDTQFLFDIGADAAGMVIPGGTIAVKLAKRYIDSRKK